MAGRNGSGFDHDVTTQQPMAGFELKTMNESGGAGGLEQLTAMDKLICKKDRAMLEALGWECKNKYRIFNSRQQQVYFALEESSWLGRMCVGAQRGFTIHLLDGNNQVGLDVGQYVDGHIEVLTMTRVFRCCVGCCWCADGCCIYPITVTDKYGRTLGSVRMMNSCCKLRFGIFDEDDNQLYEIWAMCCPCQCPCGCTADLDFPIKPVGDGTAVGNISKIWDGVLNEVISEAHTYALTFPRELELKHKSLMLAAVFLLDFAIFEAKAEQN